MNEFYRWLVTAHGVSGLCALLTFWIAAFAKKGGPLHVRVGKVYFATMLGIIATSAPMAAIIGASGRWVTATFLAYLVLITATALWLGWRAVKRKRDQAAYRDTAYGAVAWLNLGVSIVVFAAGVKFSQVLLAGFSLVGVFTGLQMLARRARPMIATRWWLHEHYGAMIACGVATHIAFLSIGLNRLLQASGVAPPPGFDLIAWFLPLAVAIVARIVLNRRYLGDAGTAGRSPEAKVAAAG